MMIVVRDSSKGNPSTRTYESLLLPLYSIHHLKRCPDLKFNHRDHLDFRFRGCSRAWLYSGAFFSGFGTDNHYLLC